MKRIVSLVALSFTFLINSAIAGTESDSPSHDWEWTWVSSISGGLGLANAGQTQTIYLTPNIVKTYVPISSNTPLGIGELFFGVQALVYGWESQLGLELATTGNAKTQGIIWDDADSEFNNHSYQYNVNQNRIALKGKVLTDIAYGFIPWVSAGVGIGFNTAHGFINTPLIFEALPNTNFTNHTQACFTYNAGVGVQSKLDLNWQVGLGYEFANLGKSTLGKADGQTQNTGLHFSNLNVNAILFNLTYIA